MSDEEAQELVIEMVELKAILVFLISQHNVGNLQVIQSQERMGSGTYYDIEIIDGQIKLLNLKNYENHENSENRTNNPKGDQRFQRS